MMALLKVVLKEFLWAAMMAASKAERKVAVTVVCLVMKMAEWWVALMAMMMVVR